MTPSPRRLTTSLWLLGMTSFAMLLLAAAYYSQSVSSVASGRIREFVGALTLAAALPYGWILLHLARGRQVVALLAGLSCALLYLVGFGWMAVLLFLLSWGDMTFWIPAMGLPVQLLALIACMAGWRAADVDEKRTASRALGIGVPIVLVIVPLVVSSALRGHIAELPAQRKAQSADAERVVRSLQQCLIDRAARTGTGFPAQVEDLTVAGAALNDTTCSDALVDAAQARETTVLRYWAAPADEAGVRRSFLLCAQPTQVPDRGVVTVAGNDTGLMREATAGDAAREAVACGSVLGGGTTGAVRRAQACLLEYAATRASGFPPSLDQLNRDLPGCLADMIAVPSGNPHELVLRANFDTTIAVQYLPADAGSAEVVSAYQLFAQCPGRLDKAIINERNELVAGDSVATRWWLNHCQDPKAVDSRLLSQREGFRIGAATVDTSRPALSSDAPAADAATTVSPRQPIEPEPEFGATPDLPARREECQARPRACYGLAQELERAVHLDGGNPNRDETLSAAHRVMAEEANRAYARACLDGDVRACHSEADVLVNGRAAKEDLPRALSLYEQACRGGYALACVQVGELRESGRQASKRVPSAMRVTPGANATPFMMSVPDPSRPGIAKDIVASVAAFRAACALDDGASCLRAARVALAAGANADAERTRAVQDMQAFCAGGQAFACELLAQQAATGGGSIAGQTVAEWRRRACRLGEQSACGR